MPKIFVDLSDYQYDKLVKLAESRSRMEKRTFTVGDCIRGFADSCVTNGGSWKNPFQFAAEYEVEKERRAKDVGLVESK